MKGNYTATTERKAEKAREVLDQVLPYRFKCIDRTDEMGAFFQRFEKLETARIVLRREVQ
jgi:hypothetical protein